MNQVEQFENRRWATKVQPNNFRHRSALELVQGPTVLDLGCGDGLLLQMLRDNENIKGTGLDISPTAVKKALQRGVDAQVHDFAVNSLPFKDSAFDEVTLLDVLEHLYFPEEILAEARRVARRAVVIAVPNFSSLPARLQMLFGRVPENNKPKKGHVYWFNKSVLYAMLERQGMKIEAVRYNVPWETKPFFGTVARWIGKFCPSLFALTFVVRVRV